LLYSYVLYVRTYGHFVGSGAHGAQSLERGGALTIKIFTIYSLWSDTEFHEESNGVSYISIIQRYKKVKLNFRFCENMLCVCVNRHVIWNISYLLALNMAISVLIFTTIYEIELKFCLFFSGEIYLPIEWTVEAYCTINVSQLGSDDTTERS
jgi:hypothetical protein